MSANDQQSKLSPPPPERKSTLYVNTAKSTNFLSANLAWWSRGFLGVAAMLFHL